MSRTRTAALRLLTRRDYTVRELRDKLLAREFPEPEVSAALDGLVRDGLANDRRVAESAVRVAATLKGRGRYRIERELQQRGIPSSTIREVLASLPAADEREAIRRFLSRKPLRFPLGAAEHRRLFGQLQRRGFPADLIAEALRSPGHDDPYE